MLTKLFCKLVSLYVILASTVRCILNSKKRFRGFLAPLHVGISTLTLFYLVHINKTDQLKLFWLSDSMMWLRNN